MVGGNGLTASVPHHMIHIQLIVAGSERLVFELRQVFFRSNTTTKNMYILCTGVS